MPTDLADRPDATSAAVIDKFQIIEQLTRYHHAVDFKRWDDLDAILTEDCTASWPGLGVVRGLPTDNPQGREGIKDWLKAAVGEATSLHYMVNHVVDIDGDRATNRSMVAIGDQMSDLFHLGYYDGTHVRTPDGWCIRTLDFVIAPAAKRRGPPPTVDAAKPSSADPELDAVLTLLDCFERLDLAGSLAALTEDATYVPDPKSSPVEGRDAIGKLWESTFPKTIDYRVTIRHTCRAPGVVMIERDEVFSMAGRMVQLPVVGVFEVRDGRVAAWRDYWDTSALAAG